MVKMWELLESYADMEESSPMDRSDPKYPNRFFNEDGPVPIYTGTDFLAFAVTKARRAHGDHPFRWTDDQYRYALLAMRAVNSLCTHRSRYS